MNRKRSCKQQSGQPLEKKKKTDKEEFNENITTGKKSQRNLRKRSEKTSSTKHHAQSSAEDASVAQMPGKVYPKNEPNHETDILSLIMKSIENGSNGAHTRTTGACSVVPYKSRNIISSVFHSRAGHQCQKLMKQGSTLSIVSLMKQLKLFRTASPFDRRCTVLEWHPTNRSLLAAGSKGGDIILWNIDSVNKDLFIQGRGPGGSVSAMKFHPHVLTKVFTSAVDGKVCLQDFHGKHSDVLLDTMTWDYWYTSMDIQPKENVMVAGDSTGKLTLMSMEGKQSWTKKVHKSKITHAEFSRRDPWLLCTGSTDKTCKLWDVRMVKDKNSAVYTLEHTKPVNSAYFSLTDGTRLLTTDQQNEIRIYSSANWILEKTIAHPHRFFQHMTPIKAQWHPLQDIIVIGRYPDDKFPGSSRSELRTIDLMCSLTGKMVCQLSDSSAPGIVSLNKFSHHGERLASAMGVNILVWQQKEDLEAKQQKIISEMKDIGVFPKGSNSTDRLRRTDTNTSSTTTTKKQEKRVNKKLNVDNTKTKTKYI